MPPWASRILLSSWFIYTPHVYVMSQESNLSGDCLLLHHLRQIGGEEAPTGFLPMILTTTRPRKRLRRGNLAAKSRWPLRKETNAERYRVFHHETPLESLGVRSSI